MRRTGVRILVGVSGSIAAVKTPELVRLLVDKNFEVQCVMSKEAKELVSPIALATFTGKPVPYEMFGPEAYRMPHITFTEQLDLMIIAPASSNMLARCAYGLSEDLVSLCYVTTKAKVLFAPAMHPSMWEHPSTQTNVKILRDRNNYFTGPYVGPLADKTRGEGRMSEPEEIIEAVQKILTK